MEKYTEPLHLDGRAWALRINNDDGTDGFEWLHFDLVHAQARQTIEAGLSLPEFARGVLTGTDETPRIVAEGDVVAGVLPTYARTGDTNEFAIAYWHFAMTPWRLVTGRRRAARSLARIYETVRGGTRPASPAALVDRCIADFAHEVRDRLSTIGKSLDPVEDVLIEPQRRGPPTDLGGRLGAARREATQLMRVLGPLSRAMDASDEDAPAWVVFDAAHRAVHGALDDITALQDRARSLQDELATRLTEETNRRLYIVSVVTTVVMPATLLTGFFGMNTGGLPWGGDGFPHGTLYAALICIGAVISTLAILRWKQLL